MGVADVQQEYWAQGCIREYSGGLGFVSPLEAMEGSIRLRHE